MPSSPTCAPAASASDVHATTHFKSPATCVKKKLLSSAGTGHFYVAMKNKRLHPEKMEVRKFDPVVRKHVGYKETKIK